MNRSVDGLQRVVTALAVCEKVHSDRMVPALSPVLHAGAGMW